MCPGERRAEGLRRETTLVAAPLAQRGCPDAGPSMRPRPGPSEHRREHHEPNLSLWSLPVPDQENDKEQVLIP
jgi:hypothetical protein